MFEHDSYVYGNTSNQWVGKVPLTRHAVKRVLRLTVGVHYSVSCLAVYMIALPIHMQGLTASALRLLINI